MKFLIFPFLIIILALHGCRNSQKPLDSIPKHETFQLTSEILGESRTLNIWQPDSLDLASDSITLLYMLDGGIEEDFPHIANTLDTLIKSKKIKPLILVGIENTQRRRDLTGQTVVKEDKEIAPVVGGSEQFRAFIREELFPELDKRFKTKKKGIIGESLAGLFITETLLLQPDMFDFYIAFDPSLWWNSRYLVLHADSLLDSFSKAPKAFWFAGSNAEDISGNTDTLATIITLKKLPNLIWKFSNEAGETHKTIFRATKEKALIWTLNTNGF
ncbi:MAG: alpha/beta hydrolase-fold protein [Saprospiraceae bacterium]